MSSAINQLFTAGGLAAIVYGVFIVYPPAAWIVGGILATWLGVGSDKLAQRADASMKKIDTKAAKGIKGIR